MKKTLFPALAAALVLAACGTKTTGQAEVAAEAAAQQVVSSDIASFRSKPCWPSATSTRTKA